MLDKEERKSNNLQKRLHELEEELERLRSGMEGYSMERSDWEIMELERRFREIENYLENIMRASEEFVIVTDIYNKIIRMNAALVDTLGYNIEELLGKRLIDITPVIPGEYISTTGETVVISEEFVKMYEEIQSKIFQTGKNRYESYLLKKCGKIVPVEINTNIIYDEKGDKTGSVNVARDVTDQKKVFEALEKEKKKAEDANHSLSEAYQKIKILSVTDPLTGCYNRGYLMEHLSKEIMRCERYGHPFHIVMSDIDHFKRVNDTFGHQMGDLVLKEYVSCIKKNLRYGIDWLTRYGGEEFVLVLPETDLDGAWQVAERIRCHVSEIVIPFKGEKIRINASFGIAGFEHVRREEGISAEVLIGQADEYLYKAKEAGRNLVAGKRKYGVI